MKSEHMRIGGIPAILWGEDSDAVWLYVHGKQSQKECAAAFAEIAGQRGFQTLSFDLPEHGERVGEGRPCDIWNGVADLRRIGAFAMERWQRLRLFGCSLGAYFALHACADWPLERCLFQSPIVDMEALIRRMFGWFGVTEERLRAEGEIPTPVDTLSWKYYEYVRAHPIEIWPVPTAILYGGRDDLQSRTEIEGFAGRFACRLTIAEDCEHAFMAPGDAQIVGEFLLRNV